MINWFENSLAKLLLAAQYDNFKRMLPTIISIDSNYNKKILINSYNQSVTIKKSLKSIIADNLKFITDSYKTSDDEMNELIFDNLEYNWNDFEIYLKRIRYFNLDSSIIYLNKFKNNLSNRGKKELIQKLYEGISKINDILFIDHINLWDFYSKNYRKNFKIHLFNNNINNISYLLDDRLSKTIKGQFDELFIEDVDVILDVITKKTDRYKIHFDTNNLFKCIKNSSPNARKLGIKISSYFLRPSFIKSHKAIFDVPRLKNLKDDKNIKKLLIKN